MPFYRKKPVVIEAQQFTGTFRSAMRIKDFCPQVTGNIYPESDRLIDIYITTLEGTMLASPGDYIIKGVNGEFYPCKPDIFDKTYEQVPSMSDIDDPSN